LPSRATRLSPVPQISTSLMPAGALSGFGIEGQADGACHHAVPESRVCHPAPCEFRSIWVSEPKDTHTPPLFTSALILYAEGRKL